MEPKGPPEGGQEKKGSVKSSQVTKKSSTQNQTPKKEGGEKMATVDKTALEILETGNVSVLLAGIAAVVLAIVGLAGIVPTILVAASAIAIGVALVLAGIATAAEKRKILEMTQGGTITSSTMFSLGIGVEMLAGIASVVLGILALLKMEPRILLGADAIVLGVAFLAMSAADARINNRRWEASKQNELDRVTYEGAKIAIDIQVLSGIAAIALGILALIGVAAQTLILVAFLVAGGNMVIRGGMMGARVYEEFKTTAS